MGGIPFLTNIKYPEILPDHYNNHVLRRLSSMRGMFLDNQAFVHLLDLDDSIVYEVYDFNDPAGTGEMIAGLSILHAGKVGREYYMTKGHFHEVIETAEYYFCLKGNGFMVMETIEGDCCIKELKPGAILHVPSGWAHRTVNTDCHEDLVTFFVYPAFAGHDYGSIETAGFRKLVVDGGNGTEIIDNPRWTVHGINHPGD
jgi:glucose-6-phosphate isomerase